MASTELIYFTIATLLAASFLAAGASKLQDIAVFSTSLSEFGFPLNIIRYLTFAVPAWELVIAVFVLMPKIYYIGSVASAFTLTMFTIFLSYHLILNKKVVCNCFGNFSRRPTTWMAVFRNLALTGLSIMLIRMPIRVFSSQWLQIALIATAVALAEGWLIWIAYRKRRDKVFPLAKQEKKAAPTFMLPTTDGNMVSLESLISKAKPVLLVFVNPGCGLCDDLMPHISLWQKQFAQALTIQLISRRSLEENKQKADHFGIKNIAIQKDSEVANAYGITAAPSAIIVLPDGSLGTDAVVGPAEIIKMATGSEHEQIATGKDGKNSQENIESEVGQRMPKIWPEADLLEKPLQFAAGCSIVTEYPSGKVYLNNNETLVYEIDGENRVWRNFLFAIDNTRSATQILQDIGGDFEQIREYFYLCVEEAILQVP